MPKTVVRSWIVVGCAFAWSVCVTTASFAQFDVFKLGGSVGSDEGEIVTLEAKVIPPVDSKPARLSITAQIAKGYHISSITQPPGGPVRTVIKLDPSEQFKVAGDFQSTPQPEKHPEPLFDNIIVETHEGAVTWQAPLELASGVDLESVYVKGKVKFQACSDKNCLPPKDLPFEIGSKPETKAAATPAVTATPAEVAPAAPSAQTPAATATNAAAGSTLGFYSHPRAEAKILGNVEPSVAVPGGKVKLTLTAEPKEPWYVYALGDKPATLGAQPTLIVLTETSGLKAGRTQPSIAPEPKEGQDLGVYKHPVSWTIEFNVPQDLPAQGTIKLAGMIGYQTCNETSCLPAQAARFDVNLPVASSAAGGALPLQFSAAVYREVGGAATTVVASPVAVAFSMDREIVLEEEGANQPTSLPLILGAALLGGLILNCMPCVLPVIGIKILGFVEQSHHDRRRVFMLNLAFTAGLIAVFMVLAALAALLHLDQADIFSSTPFLLTMSGVVFVMALSFLGTWEIPIPGFVGRGTAQQIASHEGLIGAFAKGVLTTILSTPCSGPFLGPIFGFTLTMPTHEVFLVYLCIGLGMASPYLLIGAFPAALRLLPKPGAWMDTFKEIMGFVLLGAVIFLLSSLDKKFLIPGLTLLIGLWAGCWWVGRTPSYEALSKRLIAWAGGIGISGAVGVVAMGWLVPGPETLAWKEFSLDELVQLTGERKTVLVDFTANWCPTCKYNEATALNRSAVRRLIDENQVVTLKADWTDGSDEIRTFLNKVLKSKSIPICAIFPAGRPNNPIVLRDLITKDQVLDALRKAGPSGTESPPATLTASRD
jgi:suppressor for copper-sensitivity B